MKKRDHKRSDSNKWQKGAGTGGKKIFAFNMLTRKNSWNEDKSMEGLSKWERKKMKKEKNMSKTKSLLALKDAGD